MDASGYGGMLACFGVGGAVGGTLLLWAGERVSRDRIFGAASVVFATMSAGLFYCRAFTLVYALMVAGGAAWVVAMSQLNVPAQLSVPKWVQGRALSCYQIVMQGGMAVTSVLWGELAERIGIPDALLAPPSHNSSAWPCCCATQSRERTNSTRCRRSRCPN
jgi:predicted MFS family arabinose efflux permease